MNSIIENQAEHPAANPIVPFRYDVIPPMTHELSRAWEQPDVSKFLINDKYAIMSESDFHKLLVTRR